jgi:hypothetical protein
MPSKVKPGQGQIPGRTIAKENVQDLGIGVLAIRSTLVNWSTRAETLTKVA